MEYRIAFTHGDILDEDGNVVMEAVEVESTVTMDLPVYHEAQPKVQEGFVCSDCGHIIDPPVGLDPCSIISIPCPKEECDGRAVSFSKEDGTSAVKAN